jgi:hypothetical protein
VSLNFFNPSSTISVTGLNSTSNPKSITQSTTATIISSTQKIGTGSTVKVTTSSSGKTQILDLFFQRSPGGSSAPALAVGNVLSVGKPGPIQLDLTNAKQVSVRFFYYFATGSDIQQTTITSDPKKNNKVPFSGGTPSTTVEVAPGIGKVFYSNKVETRTSSDNKAIDWPDLSCCRNFFELGDYNNNLTTMGLNTKGQTAPFYNGIHFDVEVTKIKRLSGNNRPS